MFEFHGWINLRYHTHDTNEDLQAQAFEEFKNYILQQKIEAIYMIKRRNGLDSFVITGLHNHYGNYVENIYRWVAAKLPGSYGLLFIRDDEDMKAGEDNTNQFIVWKLARGVLSKEADRYLSPCISVIEDEYDPTRDD